MENEVLIEDNGPVRLIRINRPAKLNALSMPVLDAMVAAVEEAELDPELRVVIIGAVGDHFSSGYDMLGHEKKKLGETKLRPIQDIQRIRKHGQRWRRVWESAIPVVAAVRGFCLAGGTDLLLHTDLVVCGKGAKIGFPAVRHQGVPPTNMWVERIGLAWTKRLMLTGDLMSGETAARLGLAIEVVEDDQVDAAAMALAQRVALIDKDLLMANKVSINLGVDATGRGIVQQISAVMDAVAHGGKSIQPFWERVEEIGVRDTWKERNAPFGKTEPL